MNIAFILHECSATGAPIAIFNIIKLLRKNFINIKITIFSLKGGEKALAFEKLADHFFDISKSIPKGLSNMHFDLFYFNTLESSHAHEMLAHRGVIKKNAKVVLHAHEMSATSEKYGIDKIKKLINKVDLVFCASDSVKKNLLNLGFNKNEIHVFHPFTAPSRKKIIQKITVKKNKKFVVMGCGEITLGKGIDFLIQVAKYIKDNYPKANIIFKWVGADNYKLMTFFKWDLELLNLTKNFIFRGYKKDVYPEYESSDIFFLASRQDSFPLVCIEALSSKLPILFFEETGGINKIMNEKCSIKIPYLDIQAAAEAILSLRANPNLLREMSANAYEAHLAFCKINIKQNNKFLSLLKHLLSHNKYELKS
jgi:glycosyltransferase involved in cell wall biosynthesis